MKDPMKTHISTIIALFLMISTSQAATKIVNGTGECVIQLFNENSNNAPLTLDLPPSSQQVPSSVTPAKPSYTVTDTGINVNIGSYNTWVCHNYISTHYAVGAADECIEVYINKFVTTKGQISIPGELQVRPCSPSAPAAAH